MKNKISNLLQVQAEISRQALVLGTVLFFAGVMSIATIKVSSAATGDTNMLQNVEGGAMAFDNVPNNVNFGATSLGEVNANVSTGSSGIVLNDLRGTKAGWSITGYVNSNFYSAATPATQMAVADRLTWLANAVTIANITGDTGGVVQQANNTFTAAGDAANLTLALDVGSGNNGAGAYNITNLEFQYDVPALATVAADYKTMFTLTIV